MNPAPTSPPRAAELVHEVSLIDRLLENQQRLATPVRHFSRWHDDAVAARSPSGRYRDLIPLSRPANGEQFAFEVNLDQCTACKACVTACHSLNGLDDDESWRDVGALTAEDAPYAQSVTSACHHCLDPACLHGCPVLAYEKDEATGIVRHLDDQCIGCSYCIMKCPYDVPRFNRRRGIVRKCDMCSQRLAVNEAPACVQACPNEAISIRLVSKAAMAADARQSGARLLPGTVTSDYTLPSTRYITRKTMPPGAKPSDEDTPRPEPAHLPLVFMLVLTQWAAGVFLFASSAAETWIGFALVVCGLAVSVTHLGQPLKAWRAFLGWRRSWLSREIIAFCPWPVVAFAAAINLLPPWIAGCVGLSGVCCSVMVYADTRRPFWSLPLTSVKFLGTVAVLGIATAANFSDALAIPTATLAVIKTAVECAALRRDDPALKRTLALLDGPVGFPARLRIALAMLGALSGFASPLLALALLLAAELLDRFVFFRAAAAWRMPGISWSP
jgi:formate dehydrogenase iron-sulfur subunit